MKERSANDSSHDVALALTAAGACAALALLLGRVHHLHPNVPPASTEVRNVNVRPTAYEEGLPAVGRNVLFHDARGNVIAQKRTEEDGAAPFAITSDGAITLMMGGPTYSMVSYYGLHTGDRPAGGESEKEQEHGELGMLHVSLPKAPTGVKTIGATLGRGITSPSSGNSVELQLVPDFISHGRYSVLALAMDGDDPKAYAFLERPESQPSGAIVFDAWRTDWQTVPYRIEGLDGRAGKLKAEWRARTAEAARFEMGDTHHTLRGESVVSGEFRVPRGIHADVEWDIELESPSGIVGEMGESKGTEQATVPFGRRALPPVSELALRATEDPKRPILSFAFERPVQADFVQLRVVWGEGDSHVWDIVMPPAQSGSIRLPEIPNELGSWAPNGNMKIGVGAFEASYIDGYSALVARGIEEIEESEAEQKNIRYSVRGALRAP